MTTGYVYKKRSAAQIDTKIRELKTGSGYQPFKAEYVVWKPKDGDNIIRILPPTWENPDHYGITTAIHFFIGPEKSSFICPFKGRKGLCPLCEKKQELEKLGRTEEAKAFRPTVRTVVWLIDRNDEAKGPQLWGMPLSKVDAVILENSKNKRTREIYPVDDPENGFDIFIKKTGTGLNTEYIVTLDRDSSAIKKAWLDFVVAHPVPSTLNHVDAENIRIEMEGIAPEEMEDKAVHSSAKSSLIGEDESIPFESGSEKKDATPSPSPKKGRLAALKALPPRKLFRLADAHDITIPDDLDDENLPQFLDDNLPDSAEIS